MHQNTGNSIYSLLHFMEDPNTPTLSCPTHFFFFLLPW